MATINQTPEIMPAQLPHHKVKFKQPMQRACNERNAKGKLCGGHLKRWSYGSDVKEQACGDITAAWGRGVEVYRCEHCKTLYLPNAEDLGGRNVAGYGSISDFGLTLPPKDVAAKPADAATATPPAAKEAATAATPAKDTAGKPGAGGNEVAAAEPLPAQAAPAQNPVSPAAQQVKDAPLKDPKSTAPPDAPLTAKPAVGATPPAEAPKGPPQVVEEGAISVDAVKTTDTVQRVDVPATEAGVKSAFPAAAGGEPVKPAESSSRGALPSQQDEPSSE